MKFKLLVEGWTEICHSYAMVNYFQLKYMKDNPEIELYLREVEFYSKDWNKHDETLKVENIRVYQGEEVDAVYRIHYPYNIAPHPENKDTPVFLFYTAEFQKIDFNAFGIRSVEELLNRKYLHFITPSKQSANAFKGLDVNLEIIPHGVDTQLFYPIVEKEINKYRENFGVKKTDYVFLNISAMTENKGIKLLLYTFYKLWKKHGDIYLVLKGNNIYKSNKLIDGYISELIFKGHINVQDLAQFKKRVKIIMEHYGTHVLNHIYNVADAYISASCAEGFNIPVLEAYATGLPILLPEHSPLTELMIPSSLIKSRLVKNNLGQVMIQISETDLYNKMESMILNGRKKNDPNIPPRFHWEEVGNNIIQFMKRHVIFYNKENIKTMTENTFNKKNKSAWIDAVIKFIKNNSVNTLLDIGCLYYKIFEEIQFKNIEYEGVDVLKYEKPSVVLIKEIDYKHPEKEIIYNYDLIIMNRSSMCLLNWVLENNKSKYVLLLSQEKPFVDSKFKYVKLEELKEESMYLFIQ